MNADDSQGKTTSGGQPASEMLAKPLFWIASAQRDLRRFPEEVRAVVGFALYQAQKGGKHIAAKPLKGFGGAGVLEIVEDFDGDTYRGVYTVQFAGVVYVLDAFQKKSKTGSKTPKGDIDRIKARLTAAKEHHTAWTASKKEDPSGNRTKDSKRKKE